MADNVVRVSDLPASTMVTHVLGNNGAPATTVRVPLEALASLLSVAASSTRLAFPTKAHMDAQLGYDAWTVAEVLSDSTPANNGTYIKLGASGTGSWSYQGPTTTQSIIAALADLRGDGQGDGFTATTVAGFNILRQLKGGTFLSRFFQLFADSTRGFRISWEDRGSGAIALVKAVSGKVLGHVGPYHMRTNASGMLVPWIRHLARTTELVPAQQARRLGAWAQDEMPVPALFIFTGQSNMAIQLDTGDQTIDQSGGGIWLHTSLRAGIIGTTSIQPAAVGTSPLIANPGNNTAGGLGANGLAVRFLNAVRKSRLFPAERPIWGLIIATGGEPFQSWVADNGSGGYQDGPFFRFIQQQYAVAQAKWEAMGGRGPLPIEHVCFQQGEANGDGTPYAVTDADYIARHDYLWNTLCPRLPGWHATTTITVGELGTWPGFTVSGTSYQPANARNNALQTIGNGERDPRIAYVSGRGMTSRDMTVANVNHPSTYELLGQRHAATFLQMRAGGAVRAPLVNDRGQHADHPALITVAAGATRVLGTGETIGGAVVTIGSGATVRLPPHPAGNGPLLQLRVLASCTLLPPLDTDLLYWPDGYASSLPLEPGNYIAWRESAGWRIESEAYSSRRRSRSLAWQTRFGASRVMGGVWPAGIMDFVDDVYFTGLDARAPDEMISRSGGIKNVISASGSLVTVPADALAFDHSSGQRRALFEGKSTNAIRNNIGAGGTVGTPGAAPTNWSLFSNGGWGLSREVVGTGTENGIPYVDVRIYGTATSGFSWQFIAAFETATSIAAAIGETWTASAFVKVVSGSGLDPRLIISERNSAGDYLGLSTGVSCNTGVLTRFVETYTLTNASTAYICPGVTISVANGATVDCVIRVGLPQAEKGPIATSVILTSGSAVTRSTDFSSWSALAVSTVSVTGCTIAVRGRVRNRTGYGEVLTTVSGGLTSALVGVDTVALGQVYAQAPGSSGAMNLASAAVPLDLAVCIGWDSAGQIASISGSAPTTRSGGAVGPLTEIVIGSTTLGVRDGHVVELAEVVWWPGIGVSADVQSQARAFQP